MEPAVNAYPNLSNAFTDFDLADLPAIPAEGWEDNSWCNNTCPSFYVADAEVEVFINYADPARREIGGSTRFSVLSTAAATLNHDLLSTEDWQVVLDFVAERACTHH